jgi:competence protein ComEA
MNRDQQAVVLFLSLSLCFLFFFFTRPSVPLKEGTKEPMEGERLPAKPVAGIAVEMDGDFGPRGVIQAESGMTVREALEKAGATQEKMLLPEETLSQKIDKSSRLSIVPEGGGEGRVVIEPLSPSKLKVLSVPILLNTATAEELETLPGIGPQTAQAIVEFREQHGKFYTPDDLLRVPGIGPRKLAALRSRILVK